MTAAIYTRVKSTCGVHICSKDRRVWISRRWMSPHHECRLGFRPVIANNQRQLAWPKRRSRFAQSGQLERDNWKLRRRMKWPTHGPQHKTTPRQRDTYPGAIKTRFNFKLIASRLLLLLLFAFYCYFAVVVVVLWCVVAAAVTITRFGVKYSCEFLSNWRPHNAFETPPPQDICGTFLYLFFLRFPPSCPRRGETLKTPGVVPPFETSKISR